MPYLMSYCYKMAKSINFFILFEIRETLASFDVSYAS